MFTVTFKDGSAKTFGTKGAATKAAAVPGAVLVSSRAPKAPPPPKPATPTLH